MHTIPGKLKVEFKLIHLEGQLDAQSSLQAGLVTADMRV